MVLFAVTTFVIFRFGLDRTELEGDLGAGVLVATLLFAAILAINRLFVAERDEGGFELIRLAPVDRNILFAAKATALVIYLVAPELVAVPIFALFFLDTAEGLARSPRCSSSPTSGSPPPAPRLRRSRRCRVPATCSPP